MIFGEQLISCLQVFFCHWAVKKNKKTVFELATKFLADSRNDLNTIFCDFDLAQAPC